MAEEHSFQAAEGHRLCTNNCGFFGSPTTMNLCSQCFRELSVKKSTVENPLPSSPPPPSSSSSSSSPSATSVSLSTSSEPEIAIRSLCPVPKLASVTGESDDRSAVAVEAGVGSRPNRCAACKKRVGLTGFKCRCGTTFCGTHRYPEKHGCDFDFKGVGREEIARANPLVKAEKLDNKI